MLTSIKHPPLPQHVVRRLRHRRDAAARLQAGARGMAARRTARVARAVRAVQQATDARSARIARSELWLISNSLGIPFPLDRDPTSEAGFLDASPSGPVSTCPTCVLGAESSPTPSPVALLASPPLSTSAFGWSVRDRISAELAARTHAHSSARRKRATPSPPAARCPNVQSSV